MDQPANVSQFDFSNERRASILTFGNVLHVIAKRKWLMLAIILAIPSIAAWKVKQLPKVYQTQASIIIESTIPQYLGANFNDVVQMGSMGINEEANIHTEMRVIQSDSQAEAVAQAFCTRELEPGLTIMKVYDPDLDCTDAGQVKRASGGIQGAIKVTPMRDSHIVTLFASHEIPVIAAAIANTYAQVYVERNLSQRLQQSSGAASWLGDEFKDLNKQLNTAEQRLIDFKKKNSIVSVGLEDQQNHASAKRKRLSNQLADIDVALVTLRVQRDHYRQLRDDGQLTDVAALAHDSPVMQHLKEMYIDQVGKMLELRGKYLPKHPLLEQQETRVQEIREDLVREASNALRDLEGQFDLRLKEQTALRTALDTATDETIQLDNAAVEYNRLRRELDRLLKLSDQVGGRERETSLAGHLKTNNVRVLDLARIPTGHIYPREQQVITMAFVVALLCAVGLAALLEFLDMTIKTPEDIEIIVGYPFLGLIPSIGESRVGTTSRPTAVAPNLQALVAEDSCDLWSYSNPKSPVAECCRSIRTNLLFAAAERQAKTMLVTSSGAQEGKTTTASNLAISMAQSGMRVLLVDTDMRRPRLHKAFGLPGSGDGLSKAIVMDVSPLKLIKSTGIENLDILPCGAVPPNPAELLHTERFRAIVTELAAAYDRVIFDSPPVSVVTDAVILSRITDGTVIVAKGGRTTKEAMVRTRRALQSADTKILGCIINDVDMSRPGSYGYYYYYSHYGTYYGRDAHDDKKPKAPTPPADPAKPPN